MYWFVTDETNKSPVPNQFFIYGGLVATDEQVVEITRGVEAIRSKFGYVSGDSFKFNLKSRPDQVTIDQSRQAKTELVALLNKIGVRMIVYVILHDIAAKKADAEVMEYALNTVASSYHRLLHAEDANGVMMMDREDGQHNHLSKLFQTGIKIDNWSHRLDDRILFFGMSSDNASHLSSAVDIALGAFRYCVNTAGGAGQEVVAKEIFPPLAELIWGVQKGDVKHIGGYGYIARPKTVNHYPYAARYAQLTEALKVYAASDTKE